jgi:peptidoglycan/LPS O-acetylase OafA/YrhL
MFKVPSTPQNANHSVRISELDALRGLAAMAVVLYHYTCGIQRLTTDDRIYYDGLWIGQYGVHLFFAISGFVIFMTLERTRKGSDFFISRFSRLIPVYYFGICLTAMIIWLNGALQGFLRPTTWTETALNFTMMTPLLRVHPVDPSYWTLQIELLFYLIIYSIWTTNLLRQIERILFIWVCFSILFAMGFVHPLIGSILILEYMPLFAIGIIAYRSRQDAWRPVLHVPLLGGSLLAVQLRGDPHVMLAAIAVVLVMISLAHGRLIFLRHPVLLWLGAISYPLYIIHQYIGIIIIFRLDALGLARPLSVMLTIAMMLLLAEAIRRYVEQPALRVIRDWWRGRNRVTKTSEPAAILSGVAIP